MSASYLSVLLKMAQTDRAVVLPGLRKCFVFRWVVSYIISPQDVVCYYIQPGITFGYRSGSNSPELPALRSGIQLSWIGSFELMTEAVPKHHRQKRGTRSGLLVRLRRCTHHPSLSNILLGNVQSLDNKVDQLRARISFQRNILFHRNMALSGYTVWVRSASWVLSSSRRQE